MKHNRLLLTWGAGKFGQLGNQAQEDKAELQNITPLLPEDAGGVVQVITQVSSVRYTTGNLKSLYMIRTTQLSTKV